MTTLDRRILVVDDDNAIRSLVATVLRRRGLEVDTAKNGVEALQRLEASRYLLILLDLMMPAMNGWDVLDHLATVEPAERPIVIVLTAGSESRAFKAGLVAGMVRKPFDIDLLVDTVVGCISSLEGLRKAPDAPDPARDLETDPPRRQDELN